MEADDGGPGACPTRTSQQHEMFELWGIVHEGGVRRVHAWPDGARIRRSAGFWGQFPFAPEYFGVNPAASLKRNRSRTRYPVCVEAMYKRSHASARVRNNWPHRHKCSSESWPLFSSCPSSWNKVALKVCLTMWLNTSQPCACTHQALIMVNSYCSQLAQEL